MTRFFKIIFNKEKESNEQGQAVLIAVIFFVFISLSMTLILSAPALSHLKSSQFLYDSLEAFVAAESGAEEITYRFMNGINVDGTEEVSTGRGKATVTSVQGEPIQIVSKGEVKDSIVRKVAINLDLGVGINFPYAVQVGNGGLILEQSSSVQGNVFSNGDVLGTSNDISGSVIVSGDGGILSGINVGNSAHAFRIEDSEIQEDALYKEISNTTVMGDMFPDSEPAEERDFPISYEVIDAWKEKAVDGGEINCTGVHVIDADQSLGPVHITCGLEIRGNPTITLGGHVWAEGDIILENSPVIEVDSSLGDKSVVFIADDPSDRENSSTLDLGNNPAFQGADGSSRSFIFMISLNESAELGGTIPAVENGQLATGDVFVYAPRGEALLVNNIDITGLTAYRIRARNASIINYQDGLTDTLFSTGPSAGYRVFYWQEIE
jgi:hypothetical protein